MSRFASMPKQTRNRQDYPAVHGHRGARGRMPENTLAAVSYAIAAGADAAEIDICVSADDCLVIHHDLMLSSALTCERNNQRLAKPLAVRSLSTDELANFDVGQLDRNNEYGRKYQQQISLPGTRIPLLYEFIDTVLAAAHDDFVLNIELKGDPDNDHLIPATNAYADLVVNALEPYTSGADSIASRLFIQSFDWRLVLAMQQRCPDLLYGLLTDQQADGAPRIPVAGEATEWTANIDLADFASVPAMIAATGAGVWSSQFRDLSSAQVEQAHNLGLQVFCWTVNEIEDMEEMIGLGVDVITTDYPERLVRLIACMRQNRPGK